ncbi:Pentatricopeptide repeat [Dillenia turbinata]|uniref:Pentatricopeptide repeat n=1 Tax=Dillenia turbinata TaxID=194707 RepID=A0AAN8Z3A2_9MAGN
MMYVYKSMDMLDEAIEVAKEMKQSGLLRDCASFNKIMACYATNGQLGECGELLHEMITRKMLPAEGTFKVLFTVLKKGGFPSEVVKQLNLAYQEGKPFSRQAVITSVFSVLGMHVFSLETSKLFDRAEASFDLLIYNILTYAYGGLEPDIVTYINLVNCYGKAGIVEGVKRIYSQLKYSEMEPSESLFKAVIDAYKNANKRDLAELVNQEMRYALNGQECPESEFEEVEDDISLYHTAITV